MRDGGYGVRENAHRSCSGTRIRTACHTQSHCKSHQRRRQSITSPNPFLHQITSQRTRWEFLGQVSLHSLFTQLRYRLGITILRFAVVLVHWVRFGTSHSTPKRKIACQVLRWGGAWFAQPFDYHFNRGIRIGGFIRVINRLRGLGDVIPQLV